MRNLASKICRLLILLLILLSAACAYHILTKPAAPLLAPQPAPQPDERLTMPAAPQPDERLTMPDERLTTMSAAPQPDERLTLSTPRRDYLLGEPVVLDLVFRNTSKETITVVEAIVKPHHYEIPVWIAREGALFEKFPLNSIDYEADRRVFTLKPGDDLKYKYRVVVGRGPELQLAFAKPGDYRVYVGGEEIRSWVSNVVAVRIKQPVGDDAKVWQQLNKPLFLMALQHDRPFVDVPLKMVELLRAFPNSGYASAMRHTLSKIYFDHNKRGGMRRQDLTQLASVLGITEVASFNDNRLAGRRKFLLDATKMTTKEIIAKLEETRPLPEMLRELSEASGVTLGASKEIHAPKAGLCIGLFGCYLSVGECMQVLGDELEASWERRGDGYFLVPFQASAAKPPAEKGKEDD